MVGLAFQQFDKDGNGVVDVQEVIGVYDASKHPDVISGRKTSGQVLREFLDGFDVGGEVDGKVTLSEFENYYSNISASIDDDDYFELMIRNAWHISGGEGWCANSSNRRVLVTDSNGNQRVEEIKNDLGLKSDDRTGMINRLRAQGIDVSNIDLNGGVDDQTNQNSKRSATSNAPNRAGSYNQNSTNSSSSVNNKNSASNQRSSYSTMSSNNQQTSQLQGGRGGGLNTNTLGGQAEGKTDMYPGRVLPNGLGKCTYHFYNLTHSCFEYSFSCERGSSF